MLAERRRNDLDVEPAPGADGAQRPDVALSAATQPVIVSDDQSAQLVALDEDLANERVRAVRRERARERKHTDEQRPTVGEGIQLFLAGGAADGLTISSG